MKNFDLNILRSPATSKTSNPLCSRVAWFCITMISLLLFDACVHPQGASASEMNGNAGKPEAEQAEVTHELWTCGMHPQVIQEQPGSCPICSMKLVPIQTEIRMKGDASHQESEQAEAGPQLWTCGMHPQVIQEQPGSCPICSMKLVPIQTETRASTKSPSAEHDSGRSPVIIDPAVVQNMGIQTATVHRQRLARSIRAAAIVEEAQPGIHDVTLRVRGWINRLYADTEGMMVSAGDPLLELYSPSLHVAASELIAARKASDRAPSEYSATVLRGAREKLALLGLDQATITSLAAKDRAPEGVIFRAPRSGHITHKEVVEGSAVEEGEHVLRIVDHSKLWIDAQLPESQLQLVKLGQLAKVTFPGDPRRNLEGEITFLHPHVETLTRTGIARIEIANADMSLRPGMYATVEIELEISADALAVPRSAVLDSGARQLVFLDLGDGHFEPREVQIGAIADDGTAEVLTGLREGEVVVTSGQFLLDSESRMREALAKFLASRKQSSDTPSEAPARSPRHAH